MNTYPQQVVRELRTWQKKMLRRPSLFNKISKRAQDKINSLIPEKVHYAVTVAIKQMVKGVLFGARYITGEPMRNADLHARELVVQEKIKFYRTTAAVEGGITRAGGLLMGLADFPVLIAIKIKLLFEIAVSYGFDVNDYKERLYILQIFELAFSSAARRREVFISMAEWEEKKNQLPADMKEFDWRKFQQEYRDYIDLAKIAQLIPVIGAPVGVVVNFRLIKKLGITAMNAYRMRLFPKTIAY